MINIKTIWLGLTVFLSTLSACTNVENNKNKNMATPQHAERAHVYACPMHPEIKGKKGDKCPKCGMGLKAVNQESSTAYQVQLTTLPQIVEAGKPTRLTLAIKQNKHIVPLDVSHEMKIHLMVVSEDLSWFSHIHPEEQKDGSYTVAETFPNGGKYLLFADFKPSGAEQTLNRQVIEVLGSPKTTNEGVSNKWISKVAGYTVNLTNGDDFKTNQTQHLEISIEKEGKKLRESDLQQYLGASAHIVMISQIDKEFLHIHPLSDNRFPIFAQTHIKKAGAYSMWVQFKVAGQVHTADFAVDVKQGRKSDSEDQHSGHQH